MTTPSEADAVQVTINGRAHVAHKGQLVIEAAADAGEFVPRFCYHERMAPVGKCRMCLVETDTGRGPAVTVSCMVQVAPDMKIETESPMTKRMQEGVLELLLANHPLDCPVCDKGGECPLQDQAYSHGPGESRFVEEKRHFEKPIPISDLVFLDRERCILCDRCTRFADEVAGDPLIHFTGRGSDTHIATYPDEPFSSYFSGNTVQICPVGALTASSYRFKARPWDLEQEETTCTTCAVGCRTVAQSSRDELLRLNGVDSEPVNHGWLCDRGRFNIGWVGADGRVLQPLVRHGDELVAASWNGALDTAARLIADAKAAGGADSIVVIGGARGTNEDAFAWARLAREVVGTPNFDPQVGDGLPLGLLGLDRATIDDATTAATVVLLGPDLKEELPVLYLRLRAAAESRRTRLVEVSPKQSGLTRNAWRRVPYEPGQQEAAVREALGDPAIASQLMSGPVVVVAGRANLAETADATVRAVRAVVAAAPGAKVLPAFRRGNVVGALLTTRPDGLDTRAALQAAADGKIECLVLLGADPLADFPDADLARRALAGARRILAVDTHLTASSSKAHVVLAASGFGEKAGTTTNLEGRVTSVACKVSPAGVTRPDWMIATELALALGGDLGYATVDEVTRDIAACVAGFDGVTPEAVASTVDGVLTAPADDLELPEATVDTLPDRNAYDFRLVVSRVLYDQATTTAHAPAIAHLARPSEVHIHPLDLERVGTTSGRAVKVSASRTTVVFTAVADASVLRGTAWVPFNLPGPNVSQLIDAHAAVNDVRIETL